MKKANTENFKSSINTPKVSTMNGLKFDFKKQVNLGKLN